MRVTVGMIVSQIGAGHSIEEILASYPYLEREDIMQALFHAGSGKAIASSAPTSTSCRAFHNS